MEFCKIGACCRQSPPEVLVAETAAGSVVVAVVVAGVVVAVVVGASLVVAPLGASFFSRETANPETLVGTQKNSAASWQAQAQQGPWLQGPTQGRSVNFFKFQFCQGPAPRCASLRLAAPRLPFQGPGCFKGPWVL
jgi:hypothetical protein